MTSRTESQDAHILMRFDREVAHLRPLLPPKGTPPSADIQMAIRIIGTPVVQALQANGHSVEDAIGLMRAVLYLKESSCR
jgi:hypothetical protein